MHYYYCILVPVTALPLASFTFFPCGEIRGSAVETITPSLFVHLNFGGIWPCAGQLHLIINSSGRPPRAFPPANPRDPRHPELRPPRLFPPANPRDPLEGWDPAAVLQCCGCCELHPMALFRDDVAVIYVQSPKPHLVEFPPIKATFPLSGAQIKAKLLLSGTDTIRHKGG